MPTEPTLIDFWWGGGAGIRVILTFTVQVLPKDSVERDCRVDALFTVGERGHGVCGGVGEGGERRLHIC